ncbi:NAD(P)H-dependent oxidoreductase [Celeribacter indicus]|uniref:NADPH-dependent FMN reductase n=1 Tax=Celeribacter indicus TaxID=1208324 RepID=A0A0B5DUM0_9RHOB|nr:NAD(P)H-dependent oxidoreductase [Celeribacter indicus]AJE46719.1 NADPH-dependent FMN reductase [Celeribacter indicus]SDX04748.1 FMN reductase [Celeribacter indicus]
MKISVVVGNPQAGSRTGRIAQRLAEGLAPGAEIEVIELSQHLDGLFSWKSEALDALTAGVAGADLAIFASPTYKAYFTGLLKAFLDRYQMDGLSGVTALAVMTGGDRAHSLAPSLTLVPLLIELGAMVPLRGQFFVVGKETDVDSLVDDRLPALRDQFAKLGQVCGGIG